MYVCICHQVTEDKIRETLNQGHKGSDALKKLGVGSGCGICLIDAIAQIESEMSVHSSQQIQNKIIPNQK